MVLSYTVLKDKMRAFGTHRFHNYIFMLTVYINFVEVGAKAVITEVRGGATRCSTTCTLWHVDYILEGNSNIRKMLLLLN